MKPSPHRRVLGSDHRLELWIPADPYWMAPLRALVGDIAVRAEFDLDRVCDLTLAVDEACALLIRRLEFRAARATDEAGIRCRLSVAPDEVAVSLHAHGAAPIHGAELESTFGWQVVTTLTDTARMTTDRSPDGEPTLALHLTMTRAWRSEPDR